MSIAEKMKELGSQEKLDLLAETVDEVHKEAKAIAELGEMVGNHEVLLSLVMERLEAIEEAMKSLQAAPAEQHEITKAE